MSAPARPPLFLAPSPSPSARPSDASGEITSLRRRSRSDGDGDGACAHDWQNIGYDKERRETLRACNHEGCSAREVVRWEDGSEQPSAPSAALLFHLAPDIRRARKLAFARTRVMAAL